MSAFLRDRRKQVHFVRNDGVKRRRRRSSDSALKVAFARIIVCCLAYIAFLCTVLVKHCRTRSLQAPAAASAFRFQVEQSACALMRPEPDHLIQRLEIDVRRRRNRITGAERCLMSGFWLLTNPSGTRVCRGLLMIGV